MFFLHLYAASLEALILQAVIVSVQTDGTASCSR